jgi:threonine/homoserine/homoserine lactone efflux protein
MLPEDLPSFVLAGFALTGSPGPATLGLAASGAAFGVGRSLKLALGIIAGVLAVMLLTASGLAGLVLANPALGPAARILAAAYIAYLAWSIAVAPPLTDDAQGRPPPSFFAGIFLGLGNPKAYAAMAALFSGFALVAERPIFDATLKISVLLAIMAVVNLCWLMLGSVLTRCFRDPRMNRAINIGFAILLVASVAFAFLL